MASICQVVNGHLSITEIMTLKVFRIFAAFVSGTVLLAAISLAQAPPNEPESPYGGTTVEDIIVRVNDQIITKTDYDRALSEMDQAARKDGETLQQMAAAHKDLLRDLIDQQLWLSKGKELDIKGDTELTKQLDEIRKENNLASIDDLEKAVQEQGISFDDFKADRRNRIISQEVMRQEVGQRLQFTPGEVERFYEQHKQQYMQPESERLSEILVSTGQGGTDDPAKVAAAKAKADDIEARLHAGGDFAQLAKTFSDGPTAATGGDLGQYKRGQGQLPKVLEDKTFALETNQYTDPILTRQGYIILKVVQHTAGGARPFKDVQDDVEQAFYMSLMEPAVRAYLTKMRDEAAITIKAGYTDSAATYAELHPSISFSAYVPPSPKKKAKVERTRFRESTHTFRQKSGAAPAAADTTATEQTAAPAPAASKAAASKKTDKNTETATEKPGKKEKIRFGQAPRETLPTATTNSSTENAGALPETASNADEPANPLEPTRSDKKTRFSDRAREEKKAKPARAPGDASAPAPPDAAEVADRQVQSAPLGLGDSSTTGKKKKTATTVTDKTRLSNQKKNPADATAQAPQEPTPIPPVAGAPAPAQAPAPAPQQ
jgi:peptidyl-prolyl cis-trans isomerase SurA